MKKILNDYSAYKCLNNKFCGVKLYKNIEKFVNTSVKQIDIDFDVIITVLRAGLPLGLRLYELTNKPIGFISAKRHHDLNIEITYDNIPPFVNPLIVDSWIATGSTVLAIQKYLNLDSVNLFGLITSKQALERINPKNYLIGYMADGLDENNYLIPPKPFNPRDGGDDLFSRNL